jgi:hypothetical protein
MDIRFRSGHLDWLGTNIPSRIDPLDACTQTEIGAYNRSHELSEGRFGDGTRDVQLGNVGGNWKQNHIERKGRQSWFCN